MEVLQDDFHEDDAYSRDCSAFKVGWVDLFYTIDKHLLCPFISPCPYPVMYLIENHLSFLRVNFHDSFHCSVVRTGFP